MRVKLLGTSAGGAFPQWNCACSNCRGVRSGNSKFRPRTQSQVAISSDGRSWFLLNASPDLRFQIEATPELHARPMGGETRHTPITAVVLTNADLDHVLGLLLMRESQPIHVYATASVRRILTEDNTMYRMLNQKKGQLTWTEILPGESFELASGLLCTSHSIPSKYPIYVSPEKQTSLAPSEAVLGLVIEEILTAKKLAYIPGIPALDDEWQRRLAECDLILCDGTFWDDDELKRTSGATRSSREMGHVPMSGVEGSIEILSRLKRPEKIFTHINNTNPVLDESGQQHAEVIRSGIEVGRDGMEFEL